MTDRPTLQLMPGEEITIAAPMPITIVAALEFVLPVNSQALFRVRQKAEREFFWTRGQATSQSFKRPAGHEFDVFRILADGRWVVIDGAAVQCVTRGAYLVDSP